MCCESDYIGIFAAIVIMIAFMKYSIQEGSSKDRIILIVIAILSLGFDSIYPHSSPAVILVYLFLLGKLIMNYKQKTVNLKYVGIFTILFGFNIVIPILLLIQ